MGSLVDDRRYPTVVLPSELPHQWWAAPTKRQPHRLKCRTCNAAEADARTEEDDPRRGGVCPARAIRKTVVRMVAESGDAMEVVVFRGEFGATMEFGPYVCHFAPRVDAIAFARGFILATLWALPRSEFVATDPAPEPAHNVLAFRRRGDA